MRYIYYVETNLICIIILLVGYFRVKLTKNQINSPQFILRLLIIFSIVFACSDIVAGVCRGETFKGARTIIEVSNIVYLESMLAASYIWSKYVFRRLGYEISKKRKWIFRLPLVFLSVLVISNPLTHFVFTIDAANLYSRGPGVIIHWICTWFYFIYSSVISFIFIKREPNKLKRAEMIPLLLFVVAPFLCGLTQMLFYGVTSTQVGITISIIMIMFSMQEKQISLDELTGINNRSAMNYYIDNLLSHNGHANLMIMMIDINRFKSINDTYGHIAGDRILIETADALRDTCSMFGRKIFLCRYGGDEFVIIGTDIKPDEANQLIDLLRENTSKIVISPEKKDRLEISVGYYFGECHDYDDFIHQLHIADEYMYSDKKRLNAVRS